MKPRPNISIQQSFYVKTYQLCVLTPGASRELWMSLWGMPETPSMKANHAEIEFVAEGSPIYAPRYTEDLQPGVSRIGMWMPISQFSRVAEILRHGRGVRCCYWQEGNHEPIACIKDWNTEESSGDEIPQEPDLSIHVPRR